MAPKKAPSAYFVFAEEQRASVKEGLLAAAENGKVSVAEVAKVIGERWRNLSEEERTSYKLKAQERAAELAEQQQAAGDDEDAPDGVEHSAPNEGAEPHASRDGPMFPLATVKRVMMYDADVSRASSEAVKAVSKAAELFVELLATRCQERAVQRKRKTIMLQDLELVVRYDKRLIEAGLKDVIATQQARAEEAAAAAASISAEQHDAEKGEAAGAEGGVECVAAHAHKRGRPAKKPVQPEPCVRPAAKITAFFGPPPVAAT